MADKLSNQRLLELIGEIDAIVIKVEDSGHVHLRILGLEIDIYHDEGRRGVHEITRSMLEEKLGAALS